MPVTFTTLNPVDLEPNRANHSVADIISLPDSRQVGFWINAVNCVKEVKPHLFKHDCDVCHRTGILRCQKCDGTGELNRRVFKKFDATKVTLDDKKEDNGNHKCYFCQGSGVEDCRKCAAKGWLYLPLINVRKFGPHPMFENYHWNRDKMKAPRRDYEMKIQKATFNKILDESDENIKKQKEEAEKRERAERKARKAAKVEKAKAKGKDGKKDKKKDKDGKEKKKKKKAAA